jgi:glycosyltransferase involved in cell wall biosynthesis
LAADNVIVTGWVDSMAEYYAKSQIFIAPMRLGTGLQNKLLEAMATRLPCITSQLAGRPLEKAEAGKNLLICNSPQDYADAVKMLMTNAEKYRELSDAGYDFVRSNYNWETTTAKLSEIIIGTQK